MEKALEYIMSRFPDHSAKLIHLYMHDDDFKVLCEDYFLSLKALEVCRNNVMKDREAENDFTLVNLELEKEIIQLLGRTK